MKKNLPGWVLLLALAFPPAVLPAMVSSPDELDAMGQGLMDKGYYAQALDYFKSAVQADPYNWQGFQSMGDAYLKMGQYQNALDSYQKSLQINPQNPQVGILVDDLSRGIVPSSAASGTSPAAPTAVPTPPTAAQPANALASPVFTATPVPAAPTAAVTPVPTPAPAVQQAPAPKSFRPRREDIAAIDQAAYWIKIEGGYDFSMLSDITNSAALENSMVANNNWSGSAVADNNGAAARLEAGFRIDDNQGVALGAGFLKPDDDSLNWNLLNGNPPDFENETFSAYAIALSVDYYYFFPDQAGRFFLEGGGSYYLATLSVTDKYNYLISHLGSNDQDDFAGDLTARSFGLELGGGREFAIAPFLGLSFYALARYAPIGHFLGKVDQAGGGTGEYGLAKFADGEVHAVNVNFIGSNGVNYATVDFTGFDAGAALVFYP